MLESITGAEEVGAVTGEQGGGEAAAGKIIVAATFTAEPLQEPLLFWMRELNLKYEIEFAPYNQVFQVLLDGGSNFRKNRSGINVLLIRFEDWKASSEIGSAESRQSTEKNVVEFISALKISVENSPATYMVFCCQPSHATADKEGWAEFLTQMRTKLLDEFRDSGNVHIITGEYIDELYPVREFEDKYADEAGHVPYTRDYFVTLATVLARRVWSLVGPRYKVIALDCDNTLWQGVCGEDGTLGVSVAAPYALLQEFLRKQKDQGMLLCLCSKNNEQDVWDVFDRNPGMLLTRDDITGYKINWGRKSDSLKVLASELGLGLDSFIFLDDSPMECAEVAAECPSVLTLQVPERIDQLGSILKHLWAFDHFGSTDVDKRRSEIYKENQQREQMREGSSLEDFIAGLDLEIFIASLNEGTVGRVAQLTQRTNQFNSTTIRQQEAQIAELLDALGCGCLTVSVRDRFGDYGLVGVAIYTYEENSIVVKSVLLSCRALGRRVEHALLERVVADAYVGGKKWVDVAFAATEKNRPVLLFLESIKEAVKLEIASTQVYRLDVEAVMENGGGKLVCESPGSADELMAPISSGDKSRSSGSVDRAVLRRVATDLAEVDSIARAVDSAQGRRGGSLRDYVSAEGSFEEPIAEIWCTLLRLDRVGQLDDFFLCGGGSLLATQMMSRVSQHFGVQLPLGHIFNNTTLRQFGQAVAAFLSAGAVSAATPLAKVVRSAQVPLSYGQQRLWFLEQWQPGGHVYNVPVVFRVDGPLDVGVLRRSIKAIVRRHESLRTTFHLDGLQPVQRVHGEVAVPVLFFDETGGRGESWAMHVVAQEMRRPFDLSLDVPLRVVVVQREDKSVLFGMVVHHIVADGWSLDILFRELTSFYENLLEGRELELQPLPVQFAEYATWQREYLDGPVLEEQLSYWRTQLDGAALQLRLPTDMPRPATQSFRGALVPFEFPAELATTVAEMCRTEEVTPYIGLLTVLQILLRQYSGQDDISVGSPIANRTSIETEGMIGFFANTLVLRAVFPEDPSFREMLAITRKVSLGAYGHQDMPLEKLVEVLKPARGGFNPLFQVNFRVLTSVPEPLRFGGATAERVFFDPGISRFDLALELLVTEDRFEGFFEYSTDLFYRETIDRLKSDFEETLRLVARRPDVPLSVLGLDRLAGKRGIRKRAARMLRAAS